MDKRLILVLVACLLVLSSVPAVAGSVELEPTSNDGILVFESKDGMFKWWVDSRVYLDMAYYMDDDAEFIARVDGIRFLIGESRCLLGILGQRCSRAACHQNEYGGQRSPDAC